MILPYMDVPLSCINASAIEFHVPAKLIIAVLATEGGKTGQISKNKNSSYDAGSMQINSIWYPVLKKYNISPDQIKNDACLNVKVGTWILAKKIASNHDLLTGVGAYHSMTPSLNQKYSYKINAILHTINTIIKTS